MFRGAKSGVLAAAVMVAPMPCALASAPGHTWSPDQNNEGTLAAGDARLAAVKIQLPGEGTSKNGRPTNLLAAQMTVKRGATRLKMKSGYAVKNAGQLNRQMAGQDAGGWLPAGQLAVHTHQSRDLFNDVRALESVDTLSLDIASQHEFFLSTNALAGAQTDFEATLSDGQRTVKANVALRRGDLGMTSSLRTSFGRHRENVLNQAFTYQIGGSVAVHAGSQLQSRPGEGFQSYPYVQLNWAVGAKTKLMLDWKVNPRLRVAGEPVDNRLVRLERSAFGDKSQLSVAVVQRAVPGFTDMHAAQVRAKATLTDKWSLTGDAWHIRGGQDTQGLFQSGVDAVTLAKLQSQLTLKPSRKTRLNLTTSAHHFASSVGTLDKLQAKLKLTVKSWQLEARYSANFGSLDGAVPAPHSLQGYYLTQAYGALNPQPQELSVAVKFAM